MTIKFLAKPLASIGIGLATLELMFRTVLIPYAQSKLSSTDEPKAYRIANNPIQGYEYIPNVKLKCPLSNVSHETNSLGFRDKERKIEKDEDVVRIGCIGDSWTYGFCVEKDKTYPADLERFLNSYEQEKHYEVWNMGVNGYNAIQNVTGLEEFLKKNNPNFDVVILSYFLNDIDDFGNIMVYFELEKAKKSLGFSFLSPAFREWLRLMKHNTPELSKINHIERLRLYQSHSEFDKRVVQPLKKFKQLSDKYRFKSLLIIFPSLLDSSWNENEKYRYGGLHVTIQKAAVVSGVNYFDFSKYLRPSMGGRCGNHPDEFGYSIIAYHLKEYLQKTHNEIFN